MPDLKVVSEYQPAGDQTFSNFYSYPGYFKRISLHLPELRHRLRCARYLRSLNSLL